MLRQKLLVLLKSLSVTLCFYSIAYFIHADFTYHRHGETRIDTYKIWLIAKVLVAIFVLLGGVRLLAVGGDCFINRHEQNKKLQKSILQKPVSD